MFAEISTSLYCARRETGPSLDLRGKSMTMFTSRRRRILAALPLMVFLTAARTTVVPLPETMVGVDNGHKLGEAFVAHKGDVILRARVFDTEVITLEAPVSVAIAKFSQDIAAGTKLHPVLATGNTQELTGTSGRYYCGEDLRTRSTLGEALIGEWFSKYETTVRFCFVDSDDDRKLDQVFLAGAKDTAEQGARPVAPTAFAVQVMQPDEEGGEIELRVSRFYVKRNKVEFTLRMMRGGEPQSFTYITTVKEGRPQQTYPTFTTDPRKVPYPAHFNDILGAGIGVTRVDAALGEVELKINRNFPMQLFRPVSVQVQYIYIYY